MDHHLIVKHPFGDYRRGDIITDPGAVAAVLSASAEHVLRVLPAAEPEPAKAAN